MYFITDFARYIAFFLSMLSLIMCTSDCGSGCFKVLWRDNKSNGVVRMYATISVTHIPEVRIDLLTFMQIVNNFALEP